MSTRIDLATFEFCEEAGVYGGEAERIGLLPGFWPSLLLASDDGKELRFKRGMPIRREGQRVGYHYFDRPNAVAIVIFATA